MSMPEHVENTGDNLRAAAEQQAKERESEASEDPGFATPPAEGSDTAG